MSDSRPTSASALALVEQFADRVARRDLPVEPEPLAFDEESLLQRLMRALHTRLQQRDPRRRRLLAQACLALMAQPQLGTPVLQQRLGCSAGNVPRVMNELLEAGLAVRDHAGRQRPYRFTRAGEDWVLAVVKGEQPAESVG